MQPKRALAKAIVSWRGGDSRTLSGQQALDLVLEPTSAMPARPGLTTSPPWRTTVPEKPWAGEPQPKPWPT